MKKVFKWLGLFLAAILVVVAIFAAYVQFFSMSRKYEVPKHEFTASKDSALIANGAKIFSLVCKNCHFDGKTGLASGLQMMDIPLEFGKAFSANITSHKEKGLGKYTDGEIYVILRTGLKPNGSWLPPWMPKFSRMSDEDMGSVIAFLRSDAPMLAPSENVPPPSEPSFLAKFLTTIGAFPQVPLKTNVPPPNKQNSVEWGKYLALGVYDCFQCHSKDFASNNILEPEKSVGFFGGGCLPLNLEGIPMPTPNLTPDSETGIGNWTREQFISSVKWGVGANGEALRYPMIPFVQLDTLEVLAIYDYLKTVPAIKNKVEKAKI